jgi:hypothetical protein
MLPIRIIRPHQGCLHRQQAGLPPGVREVELAGLEPGDLLAAIAEVPTASNLSTPV